MPDADQNTAVAGDSVNGYGFGGGIYNSGMVTPATSTISGNTMADAGGGIYNADTATLSNSTVAGNSAGCARASCAWISR